jgi:hypothetical protein
MMTCLYITFEERVGNEKDLRRRLALLEGDPVPGSVDDLYRDIPEYSLFDR